MSTQLAVMDTRYGFTPEQIDVIKATMAPGATNEELALFLMVCQKKGLDPFSRQIYLSERKSFNTETQQWVVKKSPETTIDGFRVIAERSGRYEGQLGPFWCGEDGEWKDVWLGKNMPSAAKIAVLRKGFREPMWAVALFEEYVQTTKDGKPNKMWQKMGANQLGKCAESLALRKAFPSDLSGMYTREEMAQSTKDSEENSKEAQQDVAQRRIAELRASTPEHKALILEAAEALDEISTQTVTAPADKPKIISKPARKRGTIKFEALPAYKEIKKALLEVTGYDQTYYDILKLSNVSHADELNAEESRDVYKLMLSTHRKLKADAGLREELESYQLQMKATRFADILGSCGYESIDHLLAEASGDQTQVVLRELKEATAQV